MESRKRIIRQHIKSALQKTLLPLCYKLSKKKDIDKKLVILADLNSVSTPESMGLIKAELDDKFLTEVEKKYRSKVKRREE